MNEDTETSISQRLERKLTSEANVPFALLMVGMGTLFISRLLGSTGAGGDIVLNIAAGLGVITFAASLTMLFLTYLRRPDSLRTESHIAERLSPTPTRLLSESPTIRAMEERINQIEKRDTSNKQIEDDRLEILKREVVEQVRFAESDHLIDRAQARLESLLSRDSTQNIVRESFTYTRMRLIEESSRLRRDGSLNLAIGCSIATTGICILAYFLFFERQQLQAPDTVSALSHYMPRLGLVILIEGFSLFFLKIYKSSIEDVRYFQNELTNIEQRLTAFEMSLLGDDQDAMTDLIKSSTATERNFMLKKGETTLALERERIAATAGGVEWLKAIAPVLGKVGSK